MPSLFGGPILIAALAAAASGSGASTPVAPIHLVADPVAQGVRLTVLGESRAAVDARYTLEVASGTAAGGNRSVQSGRAHLQPGVRVTLITMTLGNVGEGEWSAKLRVEPSNGDPYEQSETSSAP